MDLYRLAQGARWPRPFAVVPVALLVAFGCAVWRPLLLVFAAIWAVMAGLAVLDARARGRRGYVTGIASAAAGPIMVALIARSTRRQIRKAGKRLRNGLPVALLFAIAGGVVAFSVGNALLDGIAFTAKAPSNALSPRIHEGDRIVVSKALLGRLSRGELVAVGPFAEAEPLLGDARVIAVGRILGMPGEWIGATEEGALYVCVQAPDIIEPVTPDLPGCVFPDETSYLTSKTAAFGPVEVPAGTVFLLADDREDLTDSRTYGPVPNGALAGRIIATVWPPGRIAVR
jgi:signal peptidase I